MTTNRRNFLKTATFAGAGAVTGSLITGCSAAQPAGAGCQVFLLTLHSGEPGMMN